MYERENIFEVNTADSFFYVCISYSSLRGFSWKIVEDLQTDETMDSGDCLSFFEACLESQRSLEKNAGRIESVEQVYTY